MLFNEIDRRVDGAVITGKQMQCSGCESTVDFEVIHYIDYCSSALPLLALLFDRKYYTLTCPECGLSAEAGWFPILLELSDVGLIIFASSGIDDGGGIDGFHHYAAPVVSYLNAERQQRISRTPYAIVYGAPGLAAILHILGIDFDASTSHLIAKRRNWRTLLLWHDADDVPDRWNVDPESLLTSCDMNVAVAGDQTIPIRILHATDLGFSLAMSDGYLYGDLFFFYPSQRFIQSLVHAFLEISTAATDRESQRLIYSLFASGAFAETSHPWVLRELGRLALEVDHGAAGLFLIKSLDAQHQWLAVTSTFLDATPRRREEGEEPAPELSTAEIRRLGRRVDGQRHTLLRQFPAEEDYGRWYFPFSEDCSISSEYSLEQLGTIWGHGIRSLEYLLEGRSSLWSPAISEAIAAAERYDEFRSGFWREYLLGWNAQNGETARARLTAAIADRRQRVPSNDPLIALWTAAMRQV